HETIAKVTDDTGRRFAFNTAVAAVMELVNEISRDPEATGARFAVEAALSLIQPSAPHIAEELWQRLGHEDRLWEAPWPKADPARARRGNGPRRMCAPSRHGGRAARNRARRFCQAPCTAGRPRRRGARAR